ncbi:MAG: thioredoxin domain-containing protein [Candidatus Kerfeldbacteria bacterium]|nr:thioredoxin domain-containing protein [Candidatus Kerfeldbacteria bacterium]
MNEVSLPSQPPKRSGHWYTRWWGMLLVLMAGVTVIVAIVFLWYLARYLRAIRTGNLDLAEFASQVTPLAGTSSPSVSTRVNVSEDDDPSIGSENARIVIVEFGDFECEYSKQAFSIMRELASRYPNDVRFVYRDLPNTSIHPGAQLAHEAGECADDQDKFWQMHDKLYLNQPKFTRPDIMRYAKEINLDLTAFTSCIDSGKYKQEVAKDFADGIAAGVQGTPTWFVNGLRVPGVIPLSTWQKVIASGIE